MTQRVAGPLVRLWWWTRTGPCCRQVLREALPDIQEVLEEQGAMGWWVTELPAGEN